MTMGENVIPVDLIIQLVSGAVGGNLASIAGRSVNMGWILNTIVGLAGGAAGGQFLGPVLGPIIGAAAGATASNFDPMAILASVASGGGSGLVLTAIVGLIKNMIFKPA
jgi:hypothetical protein